MPSTTIWLTLLGMAIATYATRVTTMLALRGEIAPWLRRWLSYVPERGGTRVLAFGPALPAGVVGTLVAWRGGNVVLTILAGLATFWLLRWLGM